MADETKNVFISHIHEVDKGLAKLEQLLKNNGLTIRDFSINEDNPNNAKSEEYIKSQILAPRIQQSSTLIVYISSDTKDSTYVNWEIEYDQAKDKRIVGVWVQGENGCDIPDALNKYADAVVGWTGDNIVDAIIGKMDRWESPDGAQCQPRKITRYSCG